MVIIYIYFVELESLMLHAKFQDHRTSGSSVDFNVFTIYGRGGHLGRATRTSYTKRLFPFPKDTFTPQKVLVIPRKRWLRPNMTNKLFTGTLRINQPTNFPKRLHMTYDNNL